MMGRLCRTQSLGQQATRSKWLSFWPHLYVFLALLHSSTAAVTPQIPLQAVESERPFSCDIRAYVRAPDLYPGQRAHGEARLAANGSSCDELISWNLVLRMRERSVARLPASADKLPRKPVFNQTLQDEYYKNAESPYEQSWNNIIALGHEVYSSMERLMSPYDKAMEQYNRQMANASLWQVYSAERIVFESCTRLSEIQSGSVSMPSKAVKTFGIAVPDCNFPPSHSGVHTNDRNLAEAVAVESRLEYFFRLGLRNSSTIEVPAGFTVFDAAPASAEIDLPDTVSRSLIPLRRVQHEWEVQVRPCRSGDEGDAQGASVPQYELEVTHPPYLVQGRNVTVSVSLKSLNHSSARLPPSKIAIKAYTIPTFSWAASLVSSPQAKQRVLSLQGRGGLGDEHRSMRQRRAKTVLAQDSDQGTMGCQADPFWEAMMGGAPRSAAHIDARNGSVCDHFFDLGLTVPEDLLPSHRTTFVEFVSHLSFEIYVPEVPPPQRGVHDDHEDDDSWSDDPVSDVRKYARFAGRTAIVVRPRDGLEANASVAPSYLTEACLAPVLLNRTATEHESIPFVPVSLTLLSESDENRVMRNRYEPSRCGGSPGQPCGGRYEMVGNVWARRLYREAVGNT